MVGESERVGLANGQNEKTPQVNRRKKELGVNQTRKHEYQVGEKRRVGSSFGQKYCWGKNKKTKGRAQWRTLEEEKAKKKGVCGGWMGGIG